MTLSYEIYSSIVNKYTGYSQKMPINPVLEPVLPENLQPKHQNVALFGGGHVGKAIVHILSTLPMQVLWVDSRDEIFPAALPTNGWAKVSSGITVDTFLKRTAVARADQRALARMAPSILALSGHEGFPAHANAVIERHL